MSSTAWFAWNGVKSTAMGVDVQELPPITIPEERASFEEVSGRGGTIVRTEGAQIYNDMILAAVCRTANPSDIPAIAQWLSGGGEVEFGNRPGGCYRARIVNQIEFARIVASRPNREFTVNFRCQPGWLHSGAADVTVTESGTLVNNPGTLPSLPRVEIHGSGDFALTIGLQTVFLAGLTDGIILDSRLGDGLTLDGYGLLNDHWDGDILRIQPGANAVSWVVESGSVTSVKITPRWMSL